MLNAADLKVTGVITTLTWIRCDISLGSTSYDIPCHSWNECLQGTKTYGIHVHKYIHSYITVYITVCVCVYLYKLYQYKYKATEISFTIKFVTKDH